MTTHDAPLTDAEIEAIERRKDRANKTSLRDEREELFVPIVWIEWAQKRAPADIDRLIAEVRRLQHEYEALDDRFTAYCRGDDD